MNPTGGLSSLGEASCSGGEFGAANGPGPRSVGGEGTGESVGEEGALDLVERGLLSSDELESSSWSPFGCNACFGRAFFTSTCFPIMKCSSFNTNSTVSSL